VSDYGLDKCGLICGRGKEFFFYALCPDQLWGPPSLLSNGYQSPFLSPGVKHSQGMMLTIHPHLVLWSRMSRSYTPSTPKCLQGV
jgi:hypothetical protein